MAQKTLPTRSVWNELWQADPALYIALQSTAIINNALLTLFLVAAFSVMYDMICFWISQRTRQMLNYQIVDGRAGNPATGSLGKFARDIRRYSANIIAKAAFYSAVFLGIQHMASHLIVQIAWVISDASMIDSNLRRRCSRLHEKGLECSTALRFHDALDIAAALFLLITIRGLELHVELPKLRTRDANYSPGFLRLQSKCRWIVQMVLAAPIAVVYVYTRAARHTPWTCLKLLLVQASASCVVFLLGNFVCLLAALPVSALLAGEVMSRWRSADKKKDFQGTMEALEELGIMGQREM